MAEVVTLGECLVAFVASTPGEVAAPLLDALLEADRHHLDRFASA